jgi:hypothetical protein
MSAPTIDFSKYESAAPAIDFSKYESQAPAATSESVPSFWDTLSRETKAAGSTIAGMPAAVYHAFTDPATPEETDKFGGPDEVTGAKKVGLGVYRMAIAPPEVAGKFYWDAAHGKYGDASAVESAMLSESPEAIGQGAGAVVAGKVAQAAPGVASAVIEKAPAALQAATDTGAAGVRAAVRGANTVLEKAPGSVGAATGAAIGHASGVPYGGEVGGIVGGAVGRELLPKVQIPGESFGLPKRITGGPASAPAYVEPPPATNPGAPLPEAPSPELLQGNALLRPGAAPPPEPAAALGDLPVHAVQQALQELGPKAPISDLTERANNIAKLGDLLNDGLGGKPLQPNIPLRDQLNAATPNANLPEGHIPVESSALKSYKYDPIAHEFESLTQNGQHYIYGDVPPEAAAKFEAADSKGKAWNDLRKTPGVTRVATVINGKRVPFKPSAPSPEFEIPEDEWEAGHDLETAVEGSPR